MPDSVDKSFPIVGVGASAGGLEAFTQLLTHLPADSGMAFVLIQHLAPTFPSFLRQALAKATPMIVSQAEDGTTVAPNHVYVITPDADISLLNGVLILSPRTRDGPHLPIDSFLRSLAAERGSHAIGVVLSGTASDGTEGLRAIEAENGITFVQDPASARFAEMPRSALDAGVVDYALAIPDLAKELVRLGRHPYQKDPEVLASQGTAPEMAQILALVRESSGVDFAEYKPSTVQRRLGRRMALRHVDDPPAYLAILRDDPEEVRALGEDLLIHVTSFFRDRAAFEALEAQVFPAILGQKLPDEPLRVWVAGCSTGEEAYSIGMSLLDLLDDSRRAVQIFGSDLSEAAIAKARAAIYPDGALSGVSAERRRRYFDKVDHGFRINKVVRDLCVFMRHDLARDPPLSKVDVVSCRNVLIYFDEAAQKRIVQSLHYALNQPGYLLLGRAESLSTSARLFSAVDTANKIFARTALPNLLRFGPQPRPVDRQADIKGNEELRSTNEELETAKEELQSTNEELTTVNDELQSRNREVTRMNSDLLNLFATVDIPIVILDLERRIRRFTPKARMILNVLPSDQGRQIGDIKPNIDVDDLDEQIADVIDNFTTRESEVQDRTGHWHRMQIRPYRSAVDNNIDGAILSLVDIDALKHHVTEAQRAGAEAERANHAKDLFLATLGHELRTPLTSLLLQGQLLRRGSVTDAAKVRRLGELVERATRVQMQLVDDLLDVSRIVAGKLMLELHPVDLAAVVQAAVEGVEVVARRKSIRLEVVPGASLGRVAGDAVRLQQVVSNLLTNALKFTPPRGRVTVTVEEADGWASVKVTDTGAGIAAAFLSRVFNRFTQEDASITRAHGGLGLGLAIVRHLVEEHGGAVRAESAGVGQGATFVVTLPLMEVHAEAEAAPSEVDPGGSPAPVQVRDLRVLVVDDDQPTREVVADMLAEMGAKVQMAESGAAAMAVVRAFKPMVLLCDIAMPGEDGYSFIRRLRGLGLEDGGLTPALALSALGAEGDRQRALDAGFQMHLTKPVDVDLLCQAVAALAVGPTT